MTPAIVLNALLTYGPTILPLVQQVTGWIKEGKKEVTPEDIALLIKYGQDRGVDYFQAVPKQ